MTIPVLDQPWAYQHHFQLQKYLHDRDSHAAAASIYWQSTAIEFMNAVHPIPGDYRSSYWHAARRSTRVFDWIGHGRNRAKHSTLAHTHPHPTALVFPCLHCGQQDDQAHLMLHCSLPSLTPIRQRAKRLQSFAGQQLKIKFRSDFDAYFIDQILFASWVPNSSNTQRIWLGMWSTNLLTALLPPSFTSDHPMTTPDRYKYRKIIHKLTFPLTYAYRQMLKLHRPTSPNPNGICPPIPTRLRQRTGLLIPQQIYPGLPLTLSCQQSYINPTAFTFSDAAHSIHELTLGLHKKNI